MTATDKKEGLKASSTCIVVQNEKISTKNGESPADNIVRVSNISILTSHAGLNLRSKSGNESSFAGELSPDVDGVSDSPSTSNYLKSDEQRGVDRGFPSSDDNFMFFDNSLFRLATRLRTGILTRVRR